MTKSKYDKSFSTGVDGSLNAAQTLWQESLECVDNQIKVLQEMGTKADDPILKGLEAEKTFYKNMIDAVDQNKKSTQDFKAAMSESRAEGSKAEPAPSLDDTGKNFGH